MESKRIRLKQLYLIFVIMVSFFMISSCTTAEAQSIKYESYAQKLSEIGVFKGTGNGFDLDREPTRLEGLIMLIRLLGSEDKVNNIKEYNLKFDDVPEWGKKYVQYAYENGLTSGISESKFGSNSPIDSKSYLTFLLRALGYNDKNGDFSWSLANKFARSIDLLDDNMYIELNFVKFHRNYVAKLSYDALNTKIKNGNSKLIEKLINEGSIEKSKAGLIFSDEMSNKNQLKLNLEVNKETIRLTWNDIGADYYNIYTSDNIIWNKQVNPETGQSAFPSGRGITLPGLKIGKSYQFIVVAINDEKEYAASKIMTTRGPLLEYDTKEDLF